MGPSTPKTSDQNVLQLRIELQRVTPTVWRRLLVPGTVRLSKLHTILQATIGWTDFHLHQFRVGELLYGMHGEEWDDDEIDEKRFTVLEALGRDRRCLYDYDFGDSWEHEIVVEEITSTVFPLKFAVCIDGQRSCPPEDVGGTLGYAHFLDAIADVHHEEHERLLAWVGGSFDPTAFDLASVNARLQQMR